MPTTNPLAVVMEKKGLSSEKVSRDVRRKGAKASPAYVEHIAAGRMEPGWKLCEVLEALYGLDARQLKDAEYRNANRIKAA